MENTDDSSSPNSLSPLVAANVTHRSHSVELFETIDSNNKLSNKKRKVKPSHESVGNKKADSRQQRHKKETKKAQRDGVKKKRCVAKNQVIMEIFTCMIESRLEALDQAEKAIKDGSHDQYHQLLDDVESKRTRMLHIIQARRTSTENSITRFFTSQKDIAYSQYYVTCYCHRCYHG
jgi:hypothetical protein